MVRRLPSTDRVAGLAFCIGPYSKEDENSRVKSIKDTRFIVVQNDIVLFQDGKYEIILLSYHKVDDM